MAVAGAGVSAAGRPCLPIRLMVALLYLKHAYNESDESLVERWAQDVYFQFFSGQVYFEPRLPCDPAQISRFRHVLREVRCKMASLAEGVRAQLETWVQRAERVHQQGPMVGADSFPGKPYGGHTLAAQIEQTTTLLHDFG